MTVTGSSFCKALILQIRSFFILKDTLSLHAKATDKHDSHFKDSDDIHWFFIGTFSHKMQILLIT